MISEYASIGKDTRYMDLFLNFRPICYPFLFEAFQFHYLIQQHKNIADRGSNSKSRAFVSQIPHISDPPLGHLIKASQHYIHSVTTPFPSRHLLHNSKSSRSDRMEREITEEEIIKKKRSHNIPTVREPRLYSAHIFFLFFLFFPL